MYAYLSVCLLLLWAGSSEAQRFGLGSCPDFPPMENFDLERFLGTWSVLYSLNPYAECHKEYYYRNEQDQIKFTEEKYRDMLFVDTLSNNTDVLIPTDQPAEMNLNGESLFHSSFLRVVDTDYKNYALVYRCYSLLFVHRWSVSILVKDPSYNDTEVFSGLVKVLESESLTQDDLHAINHDTCKKRNEVFFSWEYDSTKLGLGITWVSPRNTTKDDHKEEEEEQRIPEEIDVSENEILRK